MQVICDSRCTTHADTMSNSNAPELLRMYIISYKYRVISVSARNTILQFPVVKRVNNVYDVARLHQAHWSGRYAPEPATVEMIVFERCFTFCASKPLFRRADEVTLQHLWCTSSMLYVAAGVCIYCHAQFQRFRKHHPQQGTTPTVVKFGWHGRCSRGVYPISLQTEYTDQRRGFLHLATCHGGIYFPPVSYKRLNLTFTSIMLHACARRRFDTLQCPPECSAVASRSRNKVLYLTWYYDPTRSALYMCVLLLSLYTTAHFNGSHAIFLLM